MKRALLLVLAACGTPPARPPSRHGNAKPWSAFDRGLDFERGRGTARSYPSAVAVYRPACQDGCGDLAACDRLFALAESSRGVLMDDVELIKLATRMCDRHDTRGCIAAMLAGTRDEDAVDPYKTTEDAVDACDKGSLGACEIVLLAGAFNIGGSGTVDDRNANAAEMMCTLGDLEGCTQALTHYRVQCSEPIDACVETQAKNAEAEKMPDVAREMRAILKRTTDACHDGDADACAALDQGLPPLALCEAGDYAVCVKLASEGDARAKQVACVAGADAGCGKTGRPTHHGILGVVPQLRKLCTDSHAQQVCDLVTQLTQPRPCP